MAIAHLQYLPILLGALAIIAFFTSYGMAVHEKHVDALFPYISDAGARPPESCIFGQFLNMAAVIGMSMVANFQYVNSEAPHFVGAFMVFGLGITYCWIQSFISYRMRAQGMSSTLTSVTRFMLSFASTVFFLITTIAGAVASAEYKNKTPTPSPSPSPTPSPTPHMKWQESDPGYDSHLASTFCEWLMAITFLLFFMTYYREFKKIVVSIKISPKETEIFYPTGDDARIVG